MCVCVCVCVCVWFLVLRPLQGYFTILRVKANIVQQITQRRHLETKKRNEKIIMFSFFVVLVLRPLQDYFTILRVKKLLFSK